MLCHVTLPGDNNIKSKRTRSLHQWWFSPLGPFITTAFIRLGFLVDRWEQCVMGRQECIRAAATFCFKADLPVVPPHLPPTSPFLMHHWSSGTPCCLPVSTKQAARHTCCSCSCTPLFQRPLTSYFHPFFWSGGVGGVRPPHFLSAGVYPITHNATPLSSFLVMNDRWPSHWQLGSWCHIITVSPFRQNYQITPVLKRPGRLTG